MRGIAHVDSKSTIDNMVAFVLSDAPLFSERVQKNIGLDGYHSYLAVEEVMRFLFLCSRSSVTLTPSLMVDNVWHELILFTKTYEKVCKKYLNHFVHHQPSNDDSQNQGNYKKTLAAYAREFGEINSIFWGTDTTDFSHCGWCEGSTN